MRGQKLPDLSWIGWDDGTVVVSTPRRSPQRMLLPPAAKRRARRIAFGCAVGALLGLGVFAAGISLLANGNLVLGTVTVIGGLVLTIIGAICVDIAALPPRVESVLLPPQEGKEFRLAFAEARVSLGTQPDRFAEKQAAYSLWRLAQDLEQRSAVASG